VAKYTFRFEDTEIPVDLKTLDSDHTITVADKTYHFTPHGEGIFAVLVDGRRSIVAAVMHRSIYYVDVDAMQFELTDASDSTVSAGAGDHAGEKDKIFAPMPGKIVKIMVAVGDEVEIKQPMVIVEAMKMENQVNARAKGRVRAINFAAGDQVDTEKAIIELDLGEC
jgi:biotin carboxyl carrier protein